MKNISLRLTIIAFMQLFVWGAWLTTLGTYGFGIKKWTNEEFGAVFMTLGIASILMPPIIGAIADRYMNSEKLYGILHILYGCTLFYLAKIDDPSTFFWVLLVGMMFYMPTLSLYNSLSYSILKKFNFNIVKDFPKIRVWGTIGFIAAMWITNIISDEKPPFEWGLQIGRNLAAFTGNIISANQFYIGGFFAILLGLYSFTLPAVPPLRENSSGNFAERLGFNSFSLFKNKNIALFFLFSLFLGAALQLTNMYGDGFLKDYAKIPAYADSFMVRYSTMIISISQISETVFILTIPFFLRRYGIKKVMLLSMFAWVLRFGLFSIGAPEGIGILAIILSNIIYGLAFDFFNISGSLFVESSTDPKLRASAQGLFMMMTNGFGAILGSYISGIVIQRYFVDASGFRDWQGIWTTFAIYAAVITVLFALFFKQKHNPATIQDITH